jgi:hypothetical protein
MEGKLRSLLRDFAWGPVAAVLDPDPSRLPRWTPTSRISP